MSNVPNITFQVNTNGGNIGSGVTFTGGTITIKKLPDPPRLCKNRRGGPSSKTFCEVYAMIPHDIHTGRSPRGHWFTWKDKEDG